MPQQDALVAFIQTASCLQTYGSKEFHCIIDQKPHALRINHNKFVVYDSPTHIVYECATPSVNIQSVCHSLPSTKPSRLQYSFC